MNHTAGDRSDAVRDKLRVWFGTTFVLVLVVGMWNWKQLQSMALSLATGGDHLVLAATSGRPEDVRAALADGADPNITGDDGFTPLMWASASGNVQSMKLLIDAGAKVYTMSPSGITPLTMAAQRGQVDAVRLLLDSGADPNQQRPHGPSPLFSAASFGHDRVVGLLLSRGTAVNARCAQDRTALMVAAGQNATTRDSIARLLNAGADPNLRDSDGNSAKDEAASAGRDDLLDMFDAYQGK